MKTLLSTMVGLATAVLAVTIANAQDMSSSSKPWLYPGLNTPLGCACLNATAATPSLVLQDYSSKPWLMPRGEFQIALFPEGATGTTTTRPAGVVHLKDSSSKPWLR
jgi:hypothetical protein